MLNGIEKIKCPICNGVFAKSSTCPHLGHDIIAHYESTESDVMELRQDLAHSQEHVKFLNKEIQDLHSDLRALHNQLRDIYKSGSQ